MRITKFSCVTTLMLALSACGGGGGGDTSTPAGPAPTYQVSITVTGLTSPGLVLQEGNNGLTTPPLAPTNNISVGFANGASYAFTVLTQPAGEVCTVVNGSGTIAGANVTNVAVNCAVTPPPPPVTYDLAGSVNGLVGTGLVLQLNGAQSLPITSNTGFAWTGALVNGQSYTVTILSQPAGSTCTVINGSGTIAGASLTNVAVNCAVTPPPPPVTYDLSGSVNGLVGTGLVLQLNGGLSMPITTNTGFAWTGALINGQTYIVTILSQPAGSTCTITNGSGTIAGASPVNVAVNCAVPPPPVAFTVGGNINGLVGTGLALQVNGSVNLPMTRNTGFTLPGTLANGQTYAVTIASQPSASVCTLSNGSGTIAKANVSNVAVNCVATGPSATLALFAGDINLQGTTDGIGTNARFDVTTGIATDNTGNIYVADYDNLAIRKIAPNGLVSTLPGLFGTYFLVGMGYGPSGPETLATDSAGNLYFTISAHYDVGAISPAGKSTLKATLPDGPTCTGHDFNINCSYPSPPLGLAVDSANNLYVADTASNTIAKVSSAGVLTVLAGTSGKSGSADGTGTSASFYYPSGIALDSLGNLIVVDSGNNTVRKVSPTGVTSTLAGTAGKIGSADGTGGAASFNGLLGITIDTNDNVYVNDFGNCTIRKITPAGLVSTVVGVAKQCSFVPGALPASIPNPNNVALYGRTLYITTGNGVAVVNNVP
jgi:sugar lactone lactonase YvrE